MARRLHLQSSQATGFKSAGIFPPNSDIFTDQDFLPSAMTDHPDPTKADDVEESESQVVAVAVQQAPSTFVQSDSISTPEPVLILKVVTPSDILPIPKGQRLGGNQRKYKRAIILTGTPTTRATKH